MSEPLRAVRDAATEVFFEGTSRGQLLLARSIDTGEYVSDQRGDRALTARRLEWVPASGAAELVSWIVPHSRSDGAGAPLALVELDEGPWLHAPLVELDGVPLRVGLRLMVRFVAPGGGEFIPAFAPAPAPGA